MSIVRIYGGFVAAIAIITFAVFGVLIASNVLTIYYPELVQNRKLLCFSSNKEYMKEYPKQTSNLTEAQVTEMRMTHKSEKVSNMRNEAIADITSMAVWCVAALLLFIPHFILLTRRCEKP